MPSIDMAALLGWLDEPLQRLQLLELFNSYVMPAFLFAAFVFVVYAILFRGRTQDEDSEPVYPAQTARTSQAARTARTAQPVLRTAVELPFEPAMPPAPAVAAPRSAQGALVVFADDSAVVRTKLGRLLTAAGYRIKAAEDGVVALGLIHEEVPALLITDLEMPNMNGFDLIANVQGDLRTENLPILAITGHEDLQARVSDVAGLYGIFKKPWHDRELLTRVNRLTSLATGARVAG